MRISSTMMFDRMATTITNNMDRTVQTQNNLYYKVHEASDNPAAQSQIMLLQTTIEVNTSYSTSANVAATATKEAETYIEGYKKATEEYLNIAEKSINGTANSEDRRVFAKELDQLINQTAMLANSKLFNNNYVFGGNRTSKPPFDFKTGPDGKIDSFKYIGSDIQNSVTIGKDVNANITYDGSKMFANHKGDSVFTKMIELRDRLLDNKPIGPEEAVSIKSTAKSFNDEAIVKSTDVAVTLNKITTTQKRYSTLDLVFSSQLSKLQDSDFAQVTVDLARFKNATKAAINTMQTVLKMTSDIISM